MGDIQIPFAARFAPKMLTRQKIATARTKAYGKPGDQFTIFGATFELINIEQKTLGTIAKHHFEEEGCASPSEFFEIWMRIHPTKPLNPADWVYFHTFKRVDETQPKAKPST